MSVCDWYFAHTYIHGRLHIGANGISWLPWKKWMKNKKAKHTHLTALYPGLPGWAGTRKLKPIWILLKQETVSGSGISWDICKSAPCSRQITMPVPHCSVFYRPDALPATQPTVSKHWRQKSENMQKRPVFWMGVSGGYEGRVREWRYADHIYSDIL